MTVSFMEETSTYSWSRFCTVNCCPSVRNYLGTWETAMSLQNIWRMKSWMLEVAQYLTYTNFIRVLTVSDFIVHHFVVHVLL